VTKPKPPARRQLEALFDANPTWKPSEEECEDTIMNAAMRMGYYVHIERKARTDKGVRTPVKGHVGWPDMVIAGFGRAWFLELKRRPNKPSLEQDNWLELLREGGADARLLWVPDDMQSFIDELVDNRNRSLNH
jgi:hypothetical protein